MAHTISSFPTGIDDHLQIPSSPKVARLSEAEAPEDVGRSYATNTNSHSDLHSAVNNSIKTIEQSALCDDSLNVLHDHSDPWDVDYSKDEYRLHPSNKHGRNLRVQNTHVFANDSKPNDDMSAAPDTNEKGIHHSIGSIDDLGDYQAVSGKLWRKKNFQDLPDTFMKQFYTLAERWQAEGYIQFPNEQLVDIIIALLKELHNVSTVLNETKQEAHKAAIQSADIIGHIWQASIKQDGSIDWGLGRDMKIPMANLNIFSGGEPTDNTVINAIRSRDVITSQDIRTK